MFLFKNGIIAPCREANCKAVLHTSAQHSGIQGSHFCTTFSITAVTKTSSSKVFSKLYVLELALDFLISFDKCTVPTSTAGARAAPHAITKCTIPKAASAHPLLTH